jgi:hypothetical protein
MNETGGGTETQSQPPLTTYAVPPPPETGEMIYVFRRDIGRLRTRVLAYRHPPTNDFATAGFSLIAVGLTALVPLITYYATNPRPPGWEAVVFWSMVIGGLLSGAVCLLAAHVFRSTDDRWRKEVVAEIDALAYRSIPTERRADEANGPRGPVLGHTESDRPPPSDLDTPSAATSD